MFSEYHCVVGPGDTVVTSTHTHKNLWMVWGKSSIESGIIDIRETKGDRMLS